MPEARKGAGPRARKERSSEGQLSAKGTRLNRRGLETREHVLAAAVTCLATGRPEAVSANLVAREAGVTWGTVQHQFGDVDGLWAAVLQHTAERRGQMLRGVPDQPDVAARVGAVVDMLWGALDLPISRAIYNLRSGLPRDRGELEKGFPLTAKAIAAWDADWATVMEGAFDGLGLDRTRLARVRAMLPSAVRGLFVEQQLSTYVDIEAGRKGLRDAVTTYLSGP